LFDATTGVRQRERRSPAAAILSVLLHAAIAGSLVAIVALQPEAVEEVVKEVEVTFFSAPPPPPPPPPPPKKKKKKKITPIPTPTPPPEEILQPQEIPEEIPEEEPEEVAEEDDGEEDDGGVEGGVEGGVKGGKVGGKVGGVEGGVVGGVGDGINTLGWGDSAGRAKRKPQIVYPEIAKMNEIEGTVVIKMLVDTKGRVVKKKDEKCTPWAKANQKADKNKWHPGKCAYIVSGPEELWYDSLMAWAVIPFVPYKSGDDFVYFWATARSVYKLK
jgi:protein TonB